MPVDTLIIFLPTLIRAKQTDRCSLCPLFLLMRSQHISQYKSWEMCIKFLKPFLPFFLIRAGGLQLTLRALSFLHLIVHARLNRHSSTLFFPAQCLFFTSPVLPPSTHTLHPHISLELNVNMNERTWRASVTHCFQRLIQIML